MCLESLESNPDHCTRLTCSHSFHTACLEPWLLLNATCPECRHPAPDSGCIVLATDALVVEHMKRWKPVTRLPVQPFRPASDEQEPLGGWVLYHSNDLTGAVIWMGEHPLPLELADYQLVLRPALRPAPSKHCPPVLFMEARYPQDLESLGAEALGLVGAVVEQDPPFGDFWVT